MNSFRENYLNNYKRDNFYSVLSNNDFQNIHNSDCQFKFSNDLSYYEEKCSKYDPKLGKLLCTSGQSNIYLKDDYIIKKYKLNGIDDCNYWINQERYFLNRFKHLTGVIKIIPNEKLQINDNLIICMEYARYNELTYFYELSEIDRIKASIQILITIDFINMSGVVHRDLKFDNILIKNINPIQIAISDFGLACPIGTEVLVRGNSALRCRTIKGNTHIYKGTEDR